MTNILILTGSVRPNNVNEKVVPLVVAQLEEKGANPLIADVRELDLPFFDSPLPPSNPEFAPTDERVLRWTEMVRNADGVVLVIPEYNRTMSPVQLNAVDWVAKEWTDKPVGLIGYGWRSGGEQAVATAREALGPQLKANVAEAQANLFMTKDINPDGSVLDEAAVRSKICNVLDELLQSIV